MDPKKGLGRTRVSASQINLLQLAKIAAELIVLGLIMAVSIECGLLAIVGAVIPMLSAERTKR